MNPVPSPRKNGAATLAIGRGDPIAFPMTAMAMNGFVSVDIR